MSYTPNNFDPTNPVGTVFASTAANEFQNIKSFFQGVMGRTSPQTVTNSIAGVTALSVSVPANSLGTLRKLRARVAILTVNSTGAAQAVSLNSTFGGTACFVAGPFSVPTGSSLLIADINILMQGATNAQMSVTEARLYAIATSGVFANITAGYPLGTIVANLAVDTTQVQVFQVTAQMQLASASFTITILEAICEWL
jgi:hypothetical protein